MRKSFYLLVMLAFVGTSAPAQESVGGGGGGARRGPDVPSLAAINVTMAGEVLQVDTERRAIQLKNKRNNRAIGLALDSKCKIKGDKKIFGKKELALEDIKEGFEVELTVRREDMKITEIKIKKATATES